VAGRGTAPGPDTLLAAAGGAMRVDKWLWQARFLKTRTLAAKHIGAEGVRVNGTRTVKPAAMVRPGDVLTFPLGHHVRVIRIEGLGERRGPAPEAQALYADLAPPDPRAATDPDAPAPVRRDHGAGRPTKRDRRAIDRFEGDGA
jgi:ribosome-associated heat shock protein Hsp15